MTRRGRMRFPATLAEVIQGAGGESGFGGRLQEAEIWLIWPEIVGNAIAARATPLRIIKGVLTVSVASGPWKQELGFLREMMKQKINTRLGREVVRDIVLKSGAQPRGHLHEPAPPLPPAKVLTQQQLSFLKEQAECITDPEIRASFMELMKAGLEHGGGA